MTLNFMLASRAGVFLSGDFALTTPTRVEVDFECQKLVPAIRSHWSALIAFAGVAKTSNSLDVGDWVSKNVSLIPIDAPIKTLMDTLIAANDWLAQLGGDRRLAFSIVGFAGRKPFVAIISNFLDLRGHMTQSPNSGLQIYFERPKFATVRVAGLVQAVQNSERVYLETLLKKNAPRDEIFQAIATITAAASGRVKGISRECVIGALFPSGAADIRPYGIADGVEHVPRFVRRYFESVRIHALRPKLSPDGKRLPIRWVGMTAKRQSQRKGKSWQVGIIHALRNVLDPVPIE